MSPIKVAPVGVTNNLRNTHDMKQLKFHLFYFQMVCFLDVYLSVL